MLNYYYWYSIVWGFVLVFYMFGWSEINTELDIKLVLFFVATIITSAVLGIFNRRKFVYKKPLAHINTNRKDMYITGIILLYFFCEFYLYGGIPMFEYSSGTKVYGGESAFKGIKTLYVIFFTFTTFYSLCLYYQYTYLHKKRLQIEYMLLLIVVFIAGHRGTAVIILFSGILISCSYSKFNLKKMLYYFCFMFGILYVFGIVGNLRSGVVWNDYSYITWLGRYSENYPKVLPDAFKWTYSYITSPLNNLNYNYIYNLDKINLLDYCSVYIPDFLGKRIIRDYSFSKNVNLVVPYFTVSTGYAGACVSGGIAGMFIMYIVQFVILYFVDKTVYRYANFLYIPTLVMINLIVFFFFFENTIAHSGFILPLLYPLLSAFFLKYKRNIFARC